MKKLGMAAITFALCWFIFIIPAECATASGTHTLLQLPNRGTRPSHLNASSALSKRSSSRRTLGGSAVAPSTQIGFLGGSAIAAGGNSAYAEVSGDFNGDAKLDTASIIGNSDGVTFSLSV